MTKQRSRPDIRRSSRNALKATESYCLPSLCSSETNARSGMRARDLLVLADLDQLQPRVARDQLLVVLDVVGVRRPQTADREDDQAHRASLVQACIALERLRPHRCARPSSDACRAASATTAGGSGSQTFCSVIRRSKSMNASGSSVRRSAKSSARISTRRDSWLETVVTAPPTSASDSADGRQRVGAGSAPPVARPPSAPPAAPPRTSRTARRSAGRAAHAARRGGGRARARVPARGGARRA